MRAFEQALTIARDIGLPVEEAPWKESATATCKTGKAATARTKQYNSCQTAEANCARLDKEQAHREGPDHDRSSRQAEECAEASAEPEEADDSGLLPRPAHGRDLSLVSGSTTGRAVLITGAASGIGRAIATQFAAAGDRVAIHDKVSAGIAEKVLAELDGTGHVVVQADLADSEAVLAMVDSAVEHLGGLDILVNNAGIFTLHPITEVSYEVWQEHWQSILGVNLIGAANVTWCAVRHMKERGGRIINVSSRGAFRGEPDAPAYGASKAGLNSFGQSLAIALAPYRIAVSTVAPGFVATDMAKEYLKPPGGDEIRAQSPFGRVAEPDEIAAAVLYLASAQAEWASGAVLDLNGASYLRT